MKKMNDNSNEILELSRSILRLAQEMHEDRKAERNSSSSKYNMLIAFSIVISALIVTSYTVTWVQEIKCSYDYDLDVKATAISNSNTNTNKGGE